MRFRSYRFRSYRWTRDFAALRQEQFLIDTKPATGEVKMVETAVQYKPLQLSQVLDSNPGPEISSPPCYH